MVNPLLIQSNSINGVYKDLCDALHVSSGTSVGAQQGKIHELRFVNFIITDPLCTVLSHPGRNASRKYMAAEWTLYTQGTNSVSAFASYAKRWAALAFDNEVSSAYGYRMLTPRNGEVSRHEYIVRQLTKSLDTKNAVAVMRDDSDLREGLKDRCCTMCLCFSCRNGALDLHVTMRSSDIWYGIPYDVFCAARYMDVVRELVSERRGEELRLGALYFSIENLHCYEAQWDKLCALCAMPIGILGTGGYRFPQFDSNAHKETAAFLEWEHKHRGSITSEACAELKAMHLHPFWETVGAMMANRTKDAPYTKRVKELFDEAREAASNSECVDRKVGCVLTDEDGNIVSKGWNSVQACNRMCDDKEHRLCEVTHAEAMAVRIKNMNGKHAAKAFVTLCPCAACMRALADAGVQEVHTLGFVHKAAGNTLPVYVHDESLPCA